MDIKLPVAHLIFRFHPVASSSASKTYSPVGIGMLQL